MSAATALRAQLESSLSERLSSTLLLHERSAPVTVSTGVTALDQLTGGLPRGALSEIVGPSSSGRTSVMMTVLAEATRRHEVCALVDASDCFDPVSADAMGVDLERLLWIRCNQRSQDSPGRKPQKRNGLGRLEQVLKITDLLLQSGGFGMVALDMGDIPAQSARRIQMNSWFRFRHAVEPTATVLLLVEKEATAKTCASLVVRLERKAFNARVSTARAIPPEGWQLIKREEHVIPANSVVSNAALFQGMQLRAEVLRTWSQRKPMQTAGAELELQAIW